MQRLKDCLTFFWLWGFLILDLNGACLGLGGGGARLWTFFCSVASASTEQTQVVIESPLSFLWSQFSVFSEFFGDGGGIAGGRCRLGGLVIVLVVVPGVAVAVVVAAAAAWCRSLILVIRLVLVIGFVLARTGLLSESFPMTGVDGMSEKFHGFEGGGFALESWLALLLTIHRCLSTGHCAQYR